MLQLSLGLLQLIPDGMSPPLGLDELLPGLVPVLLLLLQHLHNVIGQYLVYFVLRFKIGQNNECMYITLWSK